MTPGQKIIEALREAQAGNYASVTIEGQTWVPQEEVRAAFNAGLEAAIAEIRKTQMEDAERLAERVARLSQKEVDRKDNVENG